MLKSAGWRLILVIAATVWAVLFAVPNILPENARNSWPGFLPRAAVNLGLDLRGGSHLLLEVDGQALTKERLQTVADDLGKAFAEAKPRIAYSGSGVANGYARIKVVDPADQARALAAAKQLIQPISTTGMNSGPNLEVSESGDGFIQARLTQDAIEDLSRKAVNQSIEIVRRRVDALGTSEVSITRQGADRMIVEAPGVSDPEDLKRQIGKTAKMTFQMVDPNVTPEEAMRGRAPPGSIVLPQDDPREPFVAVRERALLSGDDLSDAQATYDQRSGEPVVSFKFNQRGARVFGQTTSQAVGKRFAIVLDGKVISAPVIQEAILGGSGQITGNFTVESANELAVLLRAGALPAPLSIIQQRTVGAELGQDAINAGALAGIVAIITVAVFMLLAYGFLFGGISIVALVVNFAMIIAAMSMIGATLTLPGIAGLILTIAMAVDANVLIYERMRDEVRAGRGPAMAIDSGFNKAMVTIMDANITTILAALILFQFGVGPVRGFAWTLSIGVITSVFTAVLVTQVLIGFWFRGTRPKKLPI